MDNGIISQDTYLQADLAKQQAQQDQASQAQQTQPQQHGNWFTRLLPTIGGVAGGLLGGAADVVSLGALAPLINPITGAAAGSGLAKLGENAVEGQSLGSGVLSNALQGAAFEGAGKLVSGAVGDLGKAATQEAGKITQAEKDAQELATMKTQAEELAKDQATKTAAQQTAQNQTQADLKAAADQKIAASQANYKGVKSDQANNFSEHQPYLEKIGVDSSSPTAVNNHANTVLEQSGGKLNEILNTQPGADMTGWLDSAVKKYGLKPQADYAVNEGMAKLITQKEGTTGISEAAITGSGTPLETSINNFLKSKVDENGIPLYTMKNLNEGTIPLRDLKDLRSELGTQQATEYANSKSLGKTVSPEAASTSKVNSNNLASIRNDLTSKISTPEVNKTIAQTKLSPDEELQIRTVLKNTPQAADEIINGINNAKSYEDINSLMAPAMQMKNVSNEALDLLKKVNGQAVKDRAKLGANPQQGILEAPSTPPAQVPVKPVVPEMPIPEPTPPVVPTQQSQTMQAIQGAHPLINTAIGGAKLAKTFASNPAVLNRTGSILNKISKIIPPATVGAGGVISAGAQQGGAPMNQQQGMQPNQMQQSNPLMDLYSTLQGQLAAQPADAQTGALISAISALAPKVQQQQAATQILGNLSNAYQGAGGAQGPLEGLISKISGILPGTGANVYNRQQGVTASALSQILGISPQAAMQLTPQLMATPETAQTGMSNLQQLIGTYGQ